ncbi:MAG: NAD kinase [Bacteroidales bacterium]|nr:NAD kinase [Bacteroidales bacterium]
MNIAIFGKQLSDTHIPYLEQLFDELNKRRAKICIFKPYFEELQTQIKFAVKPGVFTRPDEIKNLDILFSIGGDGTILDAVPYVQDKNVPMMGINMGRLGFLSSISKDEMKEAIDNIYKKDYRLEQRALIRISKPKELFGSLNFALNDVTLYRDKNTSLVAVHVYVDDLFLNTYWGDGLIIATPTGSTAYSLSVGGPIVTPGSENFVIAPIASHNLTVRPIVIPDKSRIKLKIEGREKTFQLTMDSRVATIREMEEIVLEKCDFKINLVQMPDHNFFSTIREKLLWGRDIRN